MKKYQIILADPPWKYNDRRNKHTRFCGGAMVHYSVMDYKEIAGLKVQDITDKNCILFLWATFPNLQEALYVMKSWGFEYKTLGFIWIKTNKNNGKPFFGIGYYTKSNSEPCLIGVKGHPKVKSNYVSQVIMSPRREHSKKPDETRNKIVELMGDLPRIELFARKPKEQLFKDESFKGWDVIGNDIDGKDIRESLELLTQKK